jgi:hypothetical protein
MNMITYRLCKNKIELGMYETQEEMQIMLDVFFAGGRINVDQYQELTALLVQKEDKKTA